MLYLWDPVNRKKNPIFHFSKPVTIKDLAGIHDITLSTVSQALRDKERVRERMRKEVKDLARKLNYQSNTVAAGLRKGKSNTLGVIVPWVNRDFFSDVILTTVDRHSREMGKYCAELFLKKWIGEKTSPSKISSSELLIRESTQKNSK
ncbi:MAG TPA: LacI family transcriptional regulator [Bacteroidetes bacterium]|nr:LacI family transcriptional regulator [Bacteroidota bacterium]